MILMAEPDGVGGGKRQGDGKAWGGIRGMKVWRNLYGGEYARLWTLWWWWTVGDSYPQPISARSVAAAETSFRDVTRS